MSEYDESEYSTGTGTSDDDLMVSFPRRPRKRTFPHRPTVLLEGEEEEDDSEQESSERLKRGALHHRNIAAPTRVEYGNGYGIENLDQIDQSQMMDYRSKMSTYISMTGSQSESSLRSESSRSGRNISTRRGISSGRPRRKRRLPGEVPGIITSESYDRDVHSSSSKSISISKLTATSATSEETSTRTRNMRNSSENSSTKQQEQEIEQTIPEQNEVFYAWGEVSSTSESNYSHSLNNDGERYQDGKNKPQVTEYQLETEFPDRQKFLNCDASFSESYVSGYSGTQSNHSEANQTRKKEKIILVEDEYDPKRPWRKAPVVEIKSGSDKSGDGLGYVSDNTCSALSTQTEGTVFIKTSTHSHRAKMNGINTGHDANPGSNKIKGETNRKGDNKAGDGNGRPKLQDKNGKHASSRSNISNRSYKSGKSSEISELKIANEALKQSKSQLRGIERHPIHRRMSGFSTMSNFTLTTQAYRKPEPFRPGPDVKSKRRYSTKTMESLERILDGDKSGVSGGRANRRYSTTTMESLEQLLEEGKHRGPPKSKGLRRYSTTTMEMLKLNSSRSLHASTRRFSDRSNRSLNSSSRRLSDSTRSLNSSARRLSDSTRSLNSSTRRLSENSDGGSTIVSVSGARRYSGNSLENLYAGARRDYLIPFSSSKSAMTLSTAGLGASKGSTVSFQSLLSMEEKNRMSASALPSIVEKRESMDQRSQSPERKLPERKIQRRKKSVVTFDIQNDNITRPGKEIDVKKGDLNRAVSALTLGSMDNNTATGEKTYSSMSSKERRKLSLRTYKRMIKSETSLGSAKSHVSMDSSDEEDLILRTSMALGGVTDEDLDEDQKERQRLLRDTIPTSNLEKDKEQQLQELGDFHADSLDSEGTIVETSTGYANANANSAELPVINMVDIQLLRDSMHTGRLSMSQSDDLKTMNRLELRQYGRCDSSILYADRNSQNSLLDDRSLCSLDTMHNDEHSIAESSIAGDGDSRSRPNMNRRSSRLDMSRATASVMGSRTVVRCKNCLCTHGRRKAVILTSVTIIIVATGLALFFFYIIPTANQIRRDRTDNQTGDDGSADGSVTVENDESSYSLVSPSPTATDAASSKLLRTGTPSPLPSPAPTHRVTFWPTPIDTYTKIYPPPGST